MIGEDPVRVQQAYEVLLRRVEARTASVVVVGLGFAGLPQAVQIARAGFRVVGLDIDANKVRRITAAEQDTHGITAAELLQLRNAGSFRATTSVDVLAEADVVALCAPTGVKPDHEADLQALTNAAKTVGEQLGPDRPALVVLESTVPVGTTRQLLPALERGTRRVGRNLWLAFSPERIDPGNSRFDIRNTPRLVGGVTPECLRLAMAFYGVVVERLHPVASPEVAEMAKLVENTFRFVNVSLVNELAQLCDLLGVDVWDVIRAAASKPYAFMAHYPGPGVGGACIPIVPRFLESAMAAKGMERGAVSWAARVNDSMPGFIVDKIARLLNERGTNRNGRPGVGLRGARVLLVGVTYKPDIQDVRGTPACAVAWQLRERGAIVNYHDPMVCEWRPIRPEASCLTSGPTSMVLDADGKLSGGNMQLCAADKASWVLESVPLDRQTLAAHDCVVILTPHSVLDYNLIVEAAPLILDTRDVYGGRYQPRVVRL